VGLGESTESITARERTSGGPEPVESPGREDAPDVRLSGLTKRYGDVVAVNGVDLEIGRGDFFTRRPYSTFSATLICGKSA
jgi:hypothetical protein